MRMKNQPSGILHLKQAIKLLLYNDTKQTPLFGAHALRCQYKNGRPNAFVLHHSRSFMKYRIISCNKWSLRKKTFNNGYAKLFSTYSMQT